MNDDQPTPPDLTGCSATLTGEALATLLAALSDQGWHSVPAPAKATPARPVHAFKTPTGRIHLQLTLFGETGAPRHRLEIAAVHPEARGVVGRPAWAIRAEQPAQAVIRTLAFATITGPIRIRIDRSLPRKGWSHLKVYEHGALLTETRYTDRRGRSVSFFPADPTIGEPAAWLIVRPGIDGHDAAIHATAATPEHLIAAAALTP